jgi:hypothetical protein
MKLLIIALSTKARRPGEDIRPAAGIAVTEVAAPPRGIRRRAPGPRQRGAALSLSGKNSLRPLFLLPTLITRAPIVH